MYDADYNETKVFTITDRPVYRHRPESELQILGATCASTISLTHRVLQSRNFTVEIHNPKGEKGT